MKTYTVEQGHLVHFLTADKAMAPVWFLVRLYLGYEWLMAGWEKVTDPAWVGSGAGEGMQKFIQGAIAKASCDPTAVVCHPGVQSWYASFLQAFVLPHLPAWSYAIAVGEVLVGLGLIVGLFTAVAAFFGFFMNLNYLFAGTTSTNPQLLLLALGLMLAHRIAGRYGLDHYARPYIHKVNHLLRFR